MTVEHVVVGPPGCGKTTWISRQVERAAEQYGPDRVMVVSLTRAAAKVAAGRVKLPQGCVGTLHSICYHALGNPRVVDGRMISDWNEEYPAWKLAGGSWQESDRPSDEGRGMSEYPGERHLQRLDRARQTMTSVPEASKRFQEVWQDFKAQYDAVDFTDMIDRAHREVETLPQKPKFILNDESQDDSALELALLRQWGKQADHLALVGDPNQSIYHWRHSSPEMATIQPTLILGQSYRVPRRVQVVAVNISRRSSTHLEAAYKARDEEGSVARLDFSYSAAEQLLAHARRLEGNVMILASCGYMLNGLINVLRSGGVPYCNPYRNEAKWNPLGRGEPRRRTALDRLEAWLAAGEMLRGGAAPEGWQLTLLAKSLLRTGAVAGGDNHIRSLPDEPTREQIASATAVAFTPDCRAAMAANEHNWLVNNLKAAHRQAMTYPLRVLARHGMDGLNETPKLILGTIHSVKGGEADHVIMAPDLSVKGYETFRRAGWAHHDGVIRTLYVGMTRARKSLSILSPVGWAVNVDLSQKQ